MLDLVDISEPPAQGGTWNDEGVVILKDFIPESLMAAYEAVWRQENADRPRGWRDPIPYMRHQELRDILLYQPLCDAIQDLIGEPPGLHLCLTGWLSTERDWHQDTYLNPPYVGDSYAAVWIALDTVHPDSGPFQYVPGSQFWPTVMQEKVRALLPAEQNDHRWPKFSEQILTPIFEQMLADSDIKPVSYLPQRGDVLIWNGRLLHRGSAPNVEGMERRSLIAHYSGISSRPDMPPALRVEDGGHYFPLTVDLEQFYGPEELCRSDGTAPAPAPASLLTKSVVWTRCKLKQLLSR